MMNGRPRNELALAATATIEARVSGVWPFRGLDHNPGVPAENFLLESVRNSSKSLDFKK